MNADTQWTTFVNFDIILPLFESCLTTSSYFYMIQYTKKKKTSVIIEVTLNGKTFLTLKCKLNLVTQKLNKIRTFITWNTNNMHRKRNIQIENTYKIISSDGLFRKHGYQVLNLIRMAVFHIHHMAVGTRSKLFFFLNYYLCKLFLLFSLNWCILYS